MHRSRLAGHQQGRSIQASISVILIQIQLVNIWMMHSLVFTQSVRTKERQQSQGKWEIQTVTRHQDSSRSEQGPKSTISNCKRQILQQIYKIIQCLENQISIFQQRQRYQCEKQHFDLLVFRLIQQCLTHRAQEKWFMNINQQIIQNISDEETATLQQSPSLSPQFPSNNTHSSSLPSIPASPPIRRSLFPLQFYLITITTTLLSKLCNLIPDQLWIIALLIHVIDTILFCAIVLAMGSRVSDMQKLQRYGSAENRKHGYGYAMQFNDDKYQNWHLVLFFVVCKWGTAEHFVVDLVVCVGIYGGYGFWVMRNKIDSAYIAISCIIISTLLLNHQYLWTTILIIHNLLGYFHTNFDPKLPITLTIIQSTDLIWFSISSLIFLTGSTPMLWQYWQYLILWFVSVIVGVKSESSVNAYKDRYLYFVLVAVVVVVAEGALWWIGVKRGGILEGCFLFCVANLFGLAVIYFHLCLQNEILCSTSHKQPSILLQQTLLSPKSTTTSPKSTKPDTLALTSIHNCQQTILKIAQLFLTFAYHSYSYLNAYYTSRSKIINHQQIGYNQIKQVMEHSQKMIWEYGWVWGWIALAWVGIWVGVAGSRERVGRWGWEGWYIGIGWIYLLFDNSSFKQLISVIPLLSLLFPNDPIIQKHQKLLSQIQSCHQSITPSILTSACLILSTLTTLFNKNTLILKLSIAFTYILLIYNIYNWYCISIQTWTSFLICMNVNGGYVLRYFWEDGGEEQRQRRKRKKMI